jgi:hypothetical protein
MPKPALPPAPEPVMLLNWLAKPGGRRIGRRRGGEARERAEAGLVPILEEDAAARVPAGEVRAVEDGARCEAEVVEGRGPRPGRGGVDADRGEDGETDDGEHRAAARASGAGDTRGAKRATSPHRDDQTEPAEAREQAAREGGLEDVARADGLEIEAADREGRRIGLVEGTSGPVEARAIADAVHDAHESDVEQVHVARDDEGIRGEVLEVEARPESDFVAAGQAVIVGRIEGIEGSDRKRVQCRRREAGEVDAVGTDLDEGELGEDAVEEGKAVFVDREIVARSVVDSDLEAEGRVAAVAEGDDVEGIAGRGAEGGRGRAVARRARGRLSGVEGAAEERVDGVGPGRHVVGGMSGIGVGAGQSGAGGQQEGGREGSQAGEHRARARDVHRRSSRAPVPGAP